MEDITTAALWFAGWYPAFALLAVLLLAWCTRTAPRDPDDPSLLEEFHAMTHDPEHTLSPRLVELKAEYESARAAEQAAQARIDNAEPQLELIWEERHGDLMHTVWKIMAEPVTHLADLAFKVEIWDQIIKDPFSGDSDDVSDPEDFVEHVPFKLLAEARQVLAAQA